MADALTGTIRREVGGLVWFEPAQPLGGIGRIVMTTRIGGLSRDPYDSLNLAFHVDDVQERVRLNRLKLMSCVGRGLLDPVVGEQVHGIRVQTVGELHAGTRWQSREHALAGTDALVTVTPRLPLVTLVADCAPVALIDPVQEVAAVIHAGWRGLAGGILDCTMTALADTWGSQPSDLVTWTGPTIGPCCYEVGPEVAEHFPSAVLPRAGDRSSLDLRCAIHYRLTAAGVQAENASGLDLCTSCNPELFYSHRRATRYGQLTTGRQALLLWLEGHDD